MPIRVAIVEDDPVLRASLERVVQGEGDLKWMGSYGSAEEFLREAQRVLDPRHREVLTPFLSTCDQVKFAGYRPDADESLATLAAARAFVRSPGADTAQFGARRVVEAAWKVFSSDDSRASLEILIATRAMRDKRATRHLGQLQQAVADLSRDLAEGLDGPHAIAVADLIWATLRGLVVSQLVAGIAMDTTREQQALVAVICAYLRESDR